MFEILLKTKHYVSVQSLTSSNFVARKKYFIQKLKKTLCENVKKH